MENQATSSASEKQKEISVTTSWGSLLQGSNCQAVPLAQAVQIGPHATTETVSAYDAFYLRHLFSPEECKALLSAAEEHGFGVTDYPKNYRGNLRLTTIDFSLQKAAWERIEPFIPKKIEVNGTVWEADGLNECWRLAKYYPGDVFRAHCDSNFRRNEDTVSFYTVNIYMNQHYKGGRTRFYPERNETVPDFEVQGETDAAVLFRQPPGQFYVHDGQKVFDGVKYLFRTDVMYKQNKS